MFIHKYKDIISVDNLLLAWKEFLSGKKQRHDVQEFQRNLMTNIFSLHRDLVNKAYFHGDYQAFKINDPKPRDIHKASVRDRLLHHAIYRITYPYFDTKFIHDSYSCRNMKGTHRGINRFKSFFRKVSINNTNACWVLKCDIRKFFASIDHYFLKDIIAKHVFDEDIIWLFEQVIDSFHTKDAIGVGLPLGNLTSQLLVNIYMNELDQWIKRVMKVKYYIRYADDFVILATDKDDLLELTYKVEDFLEDRLRLTLHPKKLYIKSFASGVDFLGFVHFLKHRTLRTMTKNRIFRNINEKNKSSYFGLLKHGNTFKIQEEIRLRMD